MTRWTAQLGDRDAERRFRRYNLPAQRRTALAALVLILLANLGGLAFSILVDHARPSAALIAAQSAVTMIGACLVVAMVRARRPRRIHRVVVAGVLFLTVTAAVLIVTGTAMGFRGALLVVGGVVVIYLSAPLPLVGVTGLGLLYSAVTIPAWLLGTDAQAVADVPYVLVTTVLAHGLSIVEARRAHMERRVLFAQRELLHQLSTADPLTGLINRRAFDAELHRAWQGWLAAAVPVSVLMVDIDHFKVLNDARGHPAGDRALQAVAAAIGAALPGGALLARYGGEEFACLLSGLDRDAAAATAERVVAAVRTAAISMPLPGAVLTVSAGAAGARPGMATAGDLLVAADRQLYRAKQAGRDRAVGEPVTVVPGASPAGEDRAPGRVGEPASPRPRPGPVVAGGQPASAGITFVSSRSSDRES